MLLSLLVAIAVIALLNGLFPGFLILITILICLIGLWILWELIDPYKLKANKYIKYLKCVGLCNNLSLGFMRQMKCNWLFKVLKHLSINSTHYYLTRLLVLLRYTLVLMKTILQKKRLLTSIHLSLHQVILVK